jgi:acyl-CoA synthetase (AMP-forming)/AMP-acid ligase II
MCSSTAFPSKCIYRMDAAMLLVLTLELRRRYQITDIVLVPSLVHQIVHHPRFKTADLNSVKSIGCGAAHLPLQLADQLRARFPGMERISEGAFLTSLLCAACDIVHFHRLRLVRIRE